MKILHLEDNPRDATLVQDLLAAEWPESFITVVATRDDFVALLKLGGYDLIISDYQLPGFNGLDALGIVQEMSPETPFVFFSGTLGEESAIDAVRSGAADYVVKDRMQRLPMSVRRVMREASERRNRHQVEAALASGATHLLLDNMTPDQLREAVVIVAGRVPTEASGGVRLDTIGAIAATGVTFVSVGRLTQSAPAADIGLDFALV